MSQTKIIDFCGSGELLSTMLADVHFCEALGNEMEGRKVTMMIFAEDEKTTLQGNDLSVNVEDDLHWDEHHERRIDVIGQNGGDGLHYQPKFGPPLWADFSAERGDDEESQI